MTVPLISEDKDKNKPNQTKYKKSSLSSDFVK